MRIFLDNFLLFYIFSFVFIYCIEDKSITENIIELTPEGKLPSKDDPDIFYIPIIHTNDIHGSFYPKKILLPSGQQYSVGGLEYLGKYISIMRKEWGNRLLYFDCGDQFQGGIESFVSKGRIMIDFFNTVKLTNAVFGNHEFDYGIEFMKNYMSLSNFNWIVDNVQNRTSEEYTTFPNQKTSSIIDIEGYKIGIIGLSTEETQVATVTNTSELKYENYINIINEKSEQLRRGGANAVVVIAHVGVYCKEDEDENKLKYNLRNKDTIQGQCRESDEVYKLLNNLKPGTIDLFLGGHKHDTAHNWINGFPYMANEKNGKYSQIVYLPFDKKTKKLINDKILMEGPLPICEKLFKNKKLCDLTVLDKDEENLFGPLVNYKFHGEIMRGDENLIPIYNKYLKLFNKFEKDDLTITYEHLESSKEKENVLGNLYTDFLRHISGADISVVNAGSFRTPFYRGNITNATIYSFDPFGNKIIRFYAFGWEIKKMFKILQSGSKGFYPVSGLKMTVQSKPKHKLLSIKSFDGINEEEIEDNKIYSMVSNEFCFPIDGSKGGDDFKKVYEWFKPRNPEALHIGNDKITRDALISYLRNIDELKSGNYYKKDKQRMRIIN